MENINVEELQIKLTITDAATQVYSQKGDDFTMHDVAKEAGTTVAEIFNYFPDKHAIVYFFYESLLIRYHLMIVEIEDFESFTLSEKLSNFAYASFDLMEERQEFVEHTFRRYILRSCKPSEYKQNIEDLLAEFIKNDAGKAASSDVFINDCSYRLIRKKYLHLVDFWINDTSEGKEKTMELTDKVTGLIQEALYTSIIDRSFDLAKFLFSNDIITQQSKMWNKLTSTFEIK
jgi:AcrR family transcriptional regulator